jgi:hypothetical protein
VNIITKGKKKLSLITKGDAPELLQELEDNRAAAAVIAINKKEADKLKQEQNQHTIERLPKRFTVQVGIEIEICDCVCSNDD